MHGTDHWKKIYNVYEIINELIWKKKIARKIKKYDAMVENFKTVFFFLQFFVWIN